MRFFNSVCCFFVVVHANEDFKHEAKKEGEHSCDDEYAAKDKEWSEDENSGKECFNDLFNEYEYGKSPLCDCDCSKKVYGACAVVVPELDEE